MTSWGMRWWPVVAGLAVGAVAIGLGVWLVRAGLEDADRWASVVGVFLNLAGVVCAAWGVVWARRAVRPPAEASGAVNVVKGGRAGSVIQGGLVDLSGRAPVAGALPPLGKASNLVDGTEVDGLLAQGDEVRGPLPPAGEAGGKHS
ncbi:hypothetical protein AB0I28_19715 [Phytomonospora sp. NPDC050363]|uniref:hypothetical protein n=1 Tax=Phytomonospora sp. NPDC050363 TaxID=3155642 RepID=UPI0033F98CD5